MDIFKSAVLSILIFVIGISAQGQDSEYNLDETYQIDQDGTVYLKSNDAEVTIRGSERSDVHLVVYHNVDVDGWELKSGEEFKMDVENRNGDLHIKEADRDGSRLLFGNVQKEYRIRVEVPRSVALNIQGDDDDYEISDIGSALRLDADDAEVELNGATGESFEFDMDDGSIRMDQGQGELKLNMDDGELNVRKADFSEIDTDVDDAELEITTSLANDGYYLFDMDDGDLEMNIAGGGGEFDINHDDNNVNIDSNFEVVSEDEERSVYRLPGGNAKIEIDTDDGDISLRTI